MYTGRNSETAVPLAHYLNKVTIESICQNVHLSLCIPLRFEPTARRCEEGMGGAHQRDTLVVSLPQLTCQSGCATMRTAESLSTSLQGLLLKGEVES